MGEGLQRAAERRQASTGWPAAPPPARHPLGPLTLQRSLQMRLLRVQAVCTGCRVDQQAAGKGGRQLRVPQLPAAVPHKQGGGAGGRPVGQHAQRGAARCSCCGLAGQRGGDGLPWRQAGAVKLLRAGPSQLPAERQGEEKRGRTGCKGTCTRGRRRLHRAWQAARSCLPARASAWRRRWYPLHNPSSGAYTHQAWGVFMQRV